MRAWPVSRSVGCTWPVGGGGGLIVVGCGGGVVVVVGAGWPRRSVGRPSSSGAGSGLGGGGGVVVAVVPLPGFLRIGRSSWSLVFSVVRRDARLVRGSAHCPSPYQTPLFWCASVMVKLPASWPAFVPS